MRENPGQRKRKRRMPRPKQEWQKKRKKKKEAKERDAQEAKAWEEEERRKEWECKIKDVEFLTMARAKLANIIWLEKYKVDHLALKRYRRHHIDESWMQAPNLDDHSAYLTAICQQKSLYPHANVMPCSSLIKPLKDEGWEDEARKAQEVVNDGLSSFVPSRVPGDPDMKPRWFIRVLQQANGKIIDHCNTDHGEDQNIGLHDLVGQLAMRWTDTTRKITRACPV